MATDRILLNGPRLWCIGRSKEPKNTEISCYHLNFQRIAQQKGEHVDNTFLQKQLLEKFAVELLHAILRQKQHTPGEA